MASIGGYNVLVVQGPYQPRGMATERIERPGVDGTAFREKGIRGTPFQITTMVDCDDAPDLAALLLNYAALQGTLVTVVDDLGTSWTNVMVLGVQPVSARAIGTSAGGLSTSAGTLATVRWTLQATE